jgi:hypothetical protein
MSSFLGTAKFMFVISEVSDCFVKNLFVLLSFKAWKRAALQNNLLLMLFSKQ